MIVAIIYLVNHICSILFLDYNDAVLAHHTKPSTISSLDCLSMIVESIDPNKLVTSSNGTLNSTILNQCC